MAKKQVKPADLYYIEWEDACGAHGWNDAEGVQATELAMCRSVGWMIASSKKSVTIVSSVNSEGQVDGHLTIPLTNIKKRIKLKVGR